MTIMRYRLTPLRMTIIRKKQEITSVCEDACGGKKTAVHCYWECKLV